MGFISLFKVHQLCLLCQKAKCSLGLSYNLPTCFSKTALHFLLQMSSVYNDRNRMPFPSGYHLIGRKICQIAPSSALSQNLLHSYNIKHFPLCWQLCPCPIYHTQVYALRTGFFSLTLLKNNWSISLCKFKIYSMIIWFTLYCEMITTKDLVNIHHPIWIG